MSPVAAGAKVLQLSATPAAAGVATLWITHRDGAPVVPLALEDVAEAAALSVPGVAKSEGGHASWSESEWRLVTSHGFDGAYRGIGVPRSTPKILQLSSDQTNSLR